MNEACWPGACPARPRPPLWGGREAGIRAPSGPWASGHLQPQLTQRLTMSLQLAALQQLLLGQQPLIELIHPREALLDRGDHLLFQDRDLLLSIGLLDPGAPQRSPCRSCRILSIALRLDSSSRNGSSSGLQSAPIGATRQIGEKAAESMAMESAPRAAQRRDRSQRGPDVRKAPDCRGTEPALQGRAPEGRGAKGRSSDQVRSALGFAWPSKLGLATPEPGG
jgi:hypothetical protein